MKWTKLFNPYAIAGGKIIKINSCGAIVFLEFAYMTYDECQATGRLSICDSSDYIIMV